MYICIIMFKRQHQILESILGDSKQGSYFHNTEQYQFCCPSCADSNGGKADGKYNLEVNFGLGKCHCWKCDFKGPILYLIKKYGTSQLVTEYLDDIRMVVASQMYKKGSFEELENIIQKEEIKLPKTFTPIGDISSLKKGKVADFLVKRHISQEMVDRYHLGYTKWDNEEYNIRSRIIIPSYDVKGNLNYWTGRDITGYEKRQKYLNVQADRKAIIFNEGLIEWDGDIILVEGIIDSIVIPNCIPLMGKQLYKDSYLYKTLKEKANANIIICLDNDTDISETKRIYRLLNKGRLKGKIKYLRMEDYKDFGEIYEAEGKTGLIKALSEAKQFSEFELVF